MSSISDSDHRSGLRNFSWGLLDKGARLGLSFFVGILVARKLGPLEFGRLSYALAWTGIVMACVELGLEAVVRRRLLGSETAQVLASAFLLRLGAAVVGYGCLFVASLYGPAQDASIMRVCGLAVIAPPLCIPELWLQMTHRMRLASLSQIAGALTGATWRILLIIKGSPLVYYACAYVAESLVAAAIIIIVARRAGLKWSLFAATIKTATSLLKSAWPLAVASLAVILYMRVDSLMLRWISGNASVGVYAVGIRFVEVWYFLPALLSTSMLPGLLTARAVGETPYFQRLQSIYNYAASGGLFLAVITSGIAYWAVPLAFGSRFEPSIPVCVIYVWTLPLVAIGVVRSQHLINEDYKMFYLKATALGLLLNILLNLLFIHWWQATGAALATVISQAVATWISSLWLKDAADSFGMQSKALLHPFYLLSNIRKLTSDAAT